MKKVLTAILAAGLFMLSSTAVVAAEEGHGANQSGDFDATPSSGDNQGNGNAPDNGTVGNADGKNPPGQAKNDPNNGYECDNNKGVGDNGGNPAHTGCTTTEEPKTPDTPECEAPGGCTITDIKTPHDLAPGDAAATAGVFETRLHELRATEVLGEVLVRDEASPEGLAYTGFETEVLLPLGLVLVVFGFALVKLSSKPRGTHFA